MSFLSLRVALTLLGSQSCAPQSSDADVCAHIGTKKSNLHPPINNSSRLARGRAPMPALASLSRDAHTGEHTLTTTPSPTPLPIGGRHKSWRYIWSEYQTPSPGTHLSNSLKKWCAPLHKMLPPTIPEAEHTLRLTCSALTHWHWHSSCSAWKIYCKLYKEDVTVFIVSGVLYQFVLKKVHRLNLLSTCTGGENTVWQPGRT